MLKQLFPEYRYISLEDPNTRQFAESDPIAFLDTYDRYVILDEVQRVPIGRVALFKLLPLDFSELQNSALLADDYAEAAVKGAYLAN